VGRRLLGAHALLVYAFLYAPIAVVVVYAFNDGRQTLNWEGFSTRWFGAALRDDAVTGAIRNSLVVALGTAVVACVLGTLLALSLPRLWRGLRIPLEALVTMTLVTPEIVFGVASLVFFTEVGVTLGLRTILVAHVVFNASVVALVVRARFVGMGHELEEASLDLGAGPIATFRQVTLPRLAPAILAGGLLSFTFSFDDFYTSFFVSGAGTTTLPLYIFSSLRFGISPVVNVVAVFVLALTAAAILVASLVLRRSGGTARGDRPGGVFPGVR
jgi:ABC-type spermidine/putrescine transport system permease subunit II